MDVVDQLTEACHDFWRCEAGLLGVREVGSIAAAMDLLASWPGRGATQLITPAEILRLAAVGHVRPVPAPIEEDLGVNRGGSKQERAQDCWAVFTTGRTGHGRKLAEDVASVAASRTAELDTLVEMEASGIEFPKQDALMVIPSRAEDASDRIRDASIGIMRRAVRMIAEELGDSAQARRVADVIAGGSHEDLARGRSDAAVEVPDDADVRGRRQEDDTRGAAIGGDLFFDDAAGRIRPGRGGLSSAGPRAVPEWRCRQPATLSP